MADKFLFNGIEGTFDLVRDDLADLATKSHTSLTDIGTNTHAQIDTHIADASLHFTEASIDHGSIAGLGDDDHTQYALLAGRSGGQTLYGGTATGNALTLSGNSTDTTSSNVDVNAVLRLSGNLYGRQTTTGNFNLFANTNSDFASGILIFNSVSRIALGTYSTGSTLNVLTSTGTVEFTGGNTALNWLTFNSNITYRTGTSGVPVRVLNWSPGITVEGAKTSAQLFLVQPVISANTVSATPSFGVRAMIVGPTHQTPTVGDATLLTASAVDFQLNMNSSATRKWDFGSTSVAASVRLLSSTGTWSHASPMDGSIAGMHITGDYTGIFTNEYSIKNEVAFAKMSHAGPAVFGADASPTNASVGLEVNSTTQALLLPRMTKTQRDALTAVNGMMVYNSTHETVDRYENGAWGGPVPPFIGYPHEHLSAASVSTANRATLTSVLVERTVIVTKLNFLVGTQSGNIDVGIYDNTGTLLVSSGSTACPAAGLASIDITDTELKPGIYWLALACDNTTATFSRTGSDCVVGSQYFDTAFPLANVTLPGTRAFRIFTIAGMVSGGAAV